MSLNHLTNDIPIKSWLNIGAHSIKCNVLESDNILVNDLHAISAVCDSLTVNGQVISPSGTT